MERKGKFTRGTVDINRRSTSISVFKGGVGGGEVVYLVIPVWAALDEFDRHGKVQECLANASLIASAFNAATTCEDMGYDGEACVKALPELVDGLEWMMEHSTSKTVRSISANLLNKCRG